MAVNVSTAKLPQVSHIYIYIYVCVPQLSARCVFVEAECNIMAGLLVLGAFSHVLEISGGDSISIYKNTEAC